MSQMCKSARCLSKFRFEGDVAALQFLLRDRVAYDRVLKFAHPLFCSAEAIRKLSLRTTEERIPGCRRRAAVSWSTRTLPGRGRPRRLLCLEVGRVLAEEGVRFDVARDCASAMVF